MSLLRLVFMGLQEADSKLIFLPWDTKLFIRVATSVLVTLIQANLHAVPKPRPEDARFARAPKQSTTPEETRNWIVLAGSTATRGTRTQYCTASGCQCLRVIQDPTRGIDWPLAM